jgi:predicted dehydrogenase
MPELRIGFLGAGGIAQAHAFALDALKYYYSDAPEIKKSCVASPTPKSREGFAQRFGFQEALPPDAIWEQEDLDALFILGPNHTHTPQLIKAAASPNISRIYVEKPIGASKKDLQQLRALERKNQGKFIMAGFQYLQKSTLRQALHQWHSEDFGDPIHFRAEYFHSGYLDAAYREKRKRRLLPIPLGGAAADLGSHILSLLTAFLGDQLEVSAAFASGRFSDVPPESDLCTTILLSDPKSGAAGTAVASRVSAGSGDHLFLDIRGSRGALRFDTATPDVYDTFLPKHGWQQHAVMSDYLPVSKFPSDYLPSGWLRAMIHAHYLFLGGQQDISQIPDLSHGITVQRLLLETAEKIHLP